MMNSFVLKRAFRKSIGILVAVVASYYVAMPEPFWLPLTTLLVMQTEVGLLLRNAIERFVCILLAIGIATLVGMYIHQFVIVSIVTVLIISLCSYISEKDALSKFSLTLPSLFAIIFLITILLPAHSHKVLYFRSYEVAIGAVIGIVINLILFPEKADVEFRKNVVPLLEAYSQYLTSIIDLLYRKPDAEQKAEACKQGVEKRLQTQSAFFPEWVYESGFNIVMRQGHRHFLVMTERVGQILFAMHYVARHSFDPILLGDVQSSLEVCVRQIENLIDALTTVLNLNKLKEAVSDLSEEISALEKAYKNAVPVSIELLDMSKDYIYLAAFIRDIKDLQVVLINLAQALYSYSKG